MIFYYYYLLILQTAKVKLLSIRFYCSNFHIQNAHLESPPCVIFCLFFFFFLTYFLRLAGTIQGTCLNDYDRYVQHNALDYTVMFPIHYYNYKILYTLTADAAQPLLLFLTSNKYISPCTALHPRKIFGSVATTNKIIENLLSLEMVFSKISFIQKSSKSFQNTEIPTSFKTTFAFQLNNATPN